MTYISYIYNLYLFKGERYYMTPFYSSCLGRFGTCLTVNSMSAAKSPGKDQVCQTSTSPWLEASLLKDRKQQNQTPWAVLQPFLPPSRDPGINGVKAFPVPPERENSSEPLLSPQFDCLSVPSHGDSNLETPCVLCSTSCLIDRMLCGWAAYHTYLLIHSQELLIWRTGENISTALSIDASWKLAGFCHGNEPAHTNWGWFSILFPLRIVNRGVLERQMLLFLKQLYSPNLGSELAQPK